MEKDLLQTVIQVESDIRKTLEAERKKAAAWLESVRVSLREKFEAEQKQLDEEFIQALNNTLKEYEAIAKQEIADADQTADRLQKLSDDILQDAVKDFILEILPPEDREKNRDRQDVKS